MRCSVGVFAFVLVYLVTGAARAEDFRIDVANVTVHAPDGWNKSEDKEKPGVMKLSIEKGEASHSSSYYVLKLGHIATNEDSTVEHFREEMIKGFPADWTPMEVTKVTVGREKLPALRMPYTFEAEGIKFRLDVILFRRGRQYTFFQFVGTQKAYAALNKEILKMVDEADINPKGGKD